MTNVRTILGGHATPPVSAVRRMAGYALVVLLLASLGACARQNGTDPPARQKVRLKGRTFHLEIAADDETRFNGLGGRESIADDGGMLFIFADARKRGFVMRDCLVDIDIIFLGPSGEVLNTHTMTVEEPGTKEWNLKTYRSGANAQFVIELQAGMIDKLGIVRGERLSLPFDQLKQYAR